MAHEEKNVCNEVFIKVKCCFPMGQLNSWCSGLLVHVRKARVHTSTQCYSILYMQVRQYYSVISSLEYYSYWRKPICLVGKGNNVVWLMDNFSYLQKIRQDQYKQVILQRLEGVHTN